MKVAQFFYLIIVIMPLNFISCSSDENEEPATDRSFCGYYKITSIYSDKDIDLNNDGIRSDDILSEMTGLHFSNGESASNYYNPDSPYFYAEVRPNHNHKGNESRFIEFNFPFQNIIDEDGENPILSYYSKQFNTYTYDLKPDNVVQINDLRPDYNEKYGMINSVTRIDTSSFKMDLSARFYDFKDKMWTKANVIVRYVKVRRWQDNF